MTYRKHSWFTFLLMYVLAFGVLSPARADPLNVDTTPTVNDAMKKLSAEVAQYVLAESETGGRIAIGSFQGPSDSGAGARIVQLLREHLKNSSCKIVDLGSVYSISGKFMGQKLDGKFVTVIEAEVRDALGSPVHTLRRKVVTAIDEGIAFFAPSSLDLTQPGSATTAINQPKAETNPQVITEHLVSSLTKPAVKIDSRQSSLIRTAVGSTYGMEIVIKDANGTYLPLDVTDANGQAKVALGITDVYAVRLYNESPYPVGCRLTIDGLHHFSLSQNSAYCHGEGIMVLEGGGVYLIKGWHHTDQISHEFKIMNYGESVAARFGSVEGVGAITATFYEIIGATLRGGQTRSLQDGATGIGEQTIQEYRQSNAKFGSPVGAVSVRYLRPAPPPADLPFVPAQ